MKMKHTFETFSAIEYLKIDIANNYSGDIEKMNWSDRIAWFDENEANLDSLIETAETPALFYAGVQAYRDYQNDIPSGYPISLDACSSGLQILAALINCETSAAQCGLINTGKREDAYTNLYGMMCEATNQAQAISRSDTKQAIMTALFNSTAMPKQIFGTGELLRQFYETMETGVPGAWALNQAMKDLWNPKAISYDWVLPDNFHVHIKVMDSEDHRVHFLGKPYDVSVNVNKPTETGRSLVANATHSVDGMVVREIQHRCDFDRDHLISLIMDITSQDKSSDREKDKLVKILWSHYKETGFLSARILNYIDKLNMGLVDSLVIAKLIQSMPDRPFKVLSVHDCFRCLPAYGNDLRKQYNLIMSNIASSDLLSSLVSQIACKKITVNKMGDISKSILESNYALS